MIVKIIFQFDDGNEKVLKNGELNEFIKICNKRSDILLPKKFNDILAKKNKGLIKGFVNESLIKAEEWTRLDNHIF